MQGHVFRSKIFSDQGRTSGFSKGEGGGKFRDSALPTLYTCIN